jgi:hypothetical protein
VTERSRPSFHAESAKDIDVAIVSGAARTLRGLPERSKCSPASFPCGRDPNLSVAAGSERRRVAVASQFGCGSSPSRQAAPVAATVLSGCICRPGPGTPRGRPRVSAAGHTGPPHGKTSSKAYGPAWLQGSRVLPGRSDAGSAVASLRSSAARTASQPPRPLPEPGPSGTPLRPGTVSHNTTVLRTPHPTGSTWLPNIRPADAPGARGGPASDVLAPVAPDHTQHPVAPHGPS